MAESGLSIRDLRVRYLGRDADALRGISLDVEPGEFVAVAGPNGAGKSTLALVAAGLLPGVVRAEVGGRVAIAGGRAGIVFPSPAGQLSGTKATVREEVAFGLENLGVPRAAMDAPIDSALATLGIEALADRSPADLSGGEQQRVAIASIVAMARPVLVLDEPTAQLDPLGTMALADLLVELAASGTAVLAAEHAPDVLGCSVRTLLLAEGTAVALDIPGRALSPAVAARAGLDAPTMVALATAAGVAPELAFDEAVVADALARLPRPSPRSAARPAPALPPALTWEPIRSHPPTGIELRGLSLRYPNGVEALHGVNLVIEPGEAVAIVGQNGSGKTTLAKHLNGLLRPSAGSVVVGGADLAGVPVHLAAATVGFAFQDSEDQLFSRTVERELRFGPGNLRLDRTTTDRLVEAALAATGLGAERTTNPYDLGPSVRKLVGLACVLAMDPAVVVLDEPTTGQDGLGVARVGAIVDALRAAGRTVVAITHDMELVARSFPRVVVLRHGEVVGDGPPGAVFAHHSLEMLASTGLRPPVAARIAARLGLTLVPRNADALLAALAGRAPASGGP